MVRQPEVALQPDPRPSTKAPEMEHQSPAANNALSRTPESSRPPDSSKPQNSVQWDPRIRGFSLGLARHGVGNGRASWFGSSRGSVDWMSEVDGDYVLLMTIWTFLAGVSSFEFLLLVKQSLRLKVP